MLIYIFYILDSPCSIG